MPEPSPSQPSTQEASGAAPKNRRPSPWQAMGFLPWLVMGMLVIGLGIFWSGWHDPSNSAGITLADIARENQQATPTSQVAPDPITWCKDTDTAFSLAARSGRPVLMDFTADWCPGCQWLKRDVYSIPEVKQLIESRYVPVKIDVTNDTGPNAEIFAHTHIRGLPSLVVFSPRGEELARYAEQELTVEDVRHWLETHYALH